MIPFSSPEERAHPTRAYPFCGCVCVCERERERVCVCECVCADATIDCGLCATRMSEDNERARADISEQWSSVWSQRQSAPKKKKGLSEQLKQGSWSGGLCVNGPTDWRAR